MSDFLKNLRKSLDSGQENDAKKTFDSILNKADSMTSSDLDKAQSKAAIEREKVKPLTPAEIEILNATAKEEQKKIEEFELKMRVDAALIAIDERVEKLLNKIAEYKMTYETLEKSTSVQEKQKLIKNIIHAVNNNDDLYGGSENVLFKRAVKLDEKDDVEQF